MNLTQHVDPENAYQANMKKYISFSLDNNEFCLDIMTVREIGGWSEPTPLPHSPDHVCGVINLRGTVLPIIDFAKRIGIRRMGPEPSRPVIIVMQIESRLFGIKVDSVSDILMIDSSKMQPLPDNTSEETHTFLESILALEDQMIRVVAPASIYHSETVDTVQ